MLEWSIIESFAQVHVSGTDLTVKPGRIVDPKDMSCAIQRELAWESLTNGDKPIITEGGALGRSQHG